MTMSVFEGQKAASAPEWHAPAITEARLVTSAAGAIR